MSALLSVLPNAAGLARFADLEAKVVRAVDHSRAESTKRAYRSDWRQFQGWCQVVGVTSLPAAALTVAAYIADLADGGPTGKTYAVSTIERRLAAISEGHKVAGHLSPTSDTVVRETMKGIRRMNGVARKQKKGVTTADIRAAVGAMAGSVQDDRDRALLLVGFAGGFRCSELAALTTDAITEYPEGLLVHLRRSKTDQEAKGRTIEIVYGSNEVTCPVRAYRRWTEQAGPGPVLRYVDRHANIAAGHLSPQGVVIVVKRHMARLGYDPADYAGHSLRRGMATTASRNGADDRTIRRTTGHKSAAGLAPYITEAQLFANPASGYLGL